MKKLLSLLFAVFTSLTISARSEIVTESYGDYDMRGKSFVITSMYSDLIDVDLKFQNYARMLEQVLMYLGAHPAQSSDEADMIVRYGFGKKGETARGFSISTLNFSQTYYHSVSSSGVGISASTGTLNFDYDYYLHLDAYDNHSQEPRMLWKTFSLAEVSFDNERYAVFSMLFVSREWMGKETKNVVYTPFGINTTDPTFEKYVYYLYKHDVFQKGRVYRVANATYSKRGERYQLFIDLVHVNGTEVTFYVVNKYAALSFFNETYLVSGEHKSKLDYKHAIEIGHTDENHSVQPMIFDAPNFDPTLPLSIVDNKKPKRTLSINDIILK